MDGVIARFDGSDLQVIDLTVIHKCSICLSFLLIIFYTGDVLFSFAHALAFYLLQEVVFSAFPMPLLLFFDSVFQVVFELPLLPLRSLKFQLLAFLTFEVVFAHDKIKH